MYLNTLKMSDLHKGHDHHLERAAVVSLIKHHQLCAVLAGHHGITHLLVLFHLGHYLLGLGSYIIELSGIDLHLDTEGKEEGP